MNLFRQIHEIVFHGNGGYTWDTVYNLPIWLRNYTFNLLEQHYSNKPEVADNQLPPTTEIQIPDFITKAPRK